MGRHRAAYEHPGDDDVNEIIGNGSLSEHYLALARDLDVMEAKVGLFFFCFMEIAGGYFMHSRMMRSIV